MKLYIVTDGEYSDYHLCCVCSTREKAEHAKKFYAADNDIEELELDALPDHPEGTFWYSVRMDHDGNTVGIDIESGEYAHKDEWRPYGDGRTISFTMWATDDKHAIKVANERRAMLIASGAWTVDWDEWRIRKLAEDKKGGEE